MRKDRPKAGDTYTVEVDEVISAKIYNKAKKVWNGEPDGFISALEEVVGTKIKSVESTHFGMRMVYDRTYTYKGGRYV